MDSTFGGRLDIGKLGPVSLGNARPIQTEGAERKVFEAEMKSVLEGAYTMPDGPASHGDYAQVIVGDKVVATLGNDGSAAMSNALGARFGSTLAMDGDGPELARRRAEQIATATGGKVVKTAAAMSQADWVSRPSLRTTIDFEGMKRDGLFDQWQRLSAGSAVGAQLLAQSPSDANGRKD